METLDSFDARLDRLIRRLLDRQCVPFLGAGISRNACCDADTVDPVDLRAEKIADALAALLQGRLPEGDGHAAAGLRELGVAVAKGHPVSLGQVAELCLSLLSPAETVAALRLDRWNEHYPTAAHHYLAVLIQEGLITELLETNYDEFVERAVGEAFGSSAPPTGNAPRAAPVIHDLATYRQYVARPRRDSHDDTLVKVVKLNGCAAAWARSKDSNPDQAARSIILTEEQLQSWGEKRWARDLLQVTVRSRSLLFLGFAGADPLVRHHVMDVVREFQELGRAPSDDDAGQWYDQPNAPFVAEYCATLQFAQYQMIRGFREAHASGSSASPHPADAFATAFRGTDSPEVRRRLGATLNPANTLPADEFVALLASEAVLRLAVGQYLSAQGLVASYLKGAMRHPDSLLSLLSEALRERQPHPEGGSGASTWVSWMQLGAPTSPTQTASAWATACFALRCQSPGRAGYKPLRSHPVAYPMLMVLLLLSYGNRLAPSLMPAAELRSRCGDEVAPAHPLGIRLFEGDPTVGRRQVLATASLDAVSVERLPDHSVLVAVGRGTLRPFKRQVRHAIPPSSSGPAAVGITVVREVYVIGDLDALRGRTDQPVELAAAKRNLQRVAQDPAAWLDRPGTAWKRFCVEVAV